MCRSVDNQPLVSTDCCNSVWIERFQTEVFARPLYRFYLRKSDCNLLLIFAGIWWFRYAHVLQISC